MRIDERLPYGYITPPLERADFDRPAAYSQADRNGVERFYDAHGEEIVPGKSKRQDAAAPTVREQQQHQRVYTPSELLAGVNDIPWSLWEKEVKRVLGPTCPAGRDAMLIDLQKAINSYEEKRNKRRQRNVAVGLAVEGNADAASGGQDADAGADAETAEAAPAPKEPEPAAAPGAVDLRAWALGQKNYRFAEIRKAIRSKYSTQISGPNERYDALLLLIKEKVVTKADARTDIQPIG